MSPLGPHRKHSPRDPCPKCDSTTSYCITFLDGTGTICGNTPSNLHRGLGFWHPTGELAGDWQDRLAREVKTIKPKAREVAPAMVDQVYGAWLEGSPLSREHRRDLRDRHFPDDLIESGNFGTHPVERSPRRKLVHELIDHFGEDVMRQIPGFGYRAERGGRPEPTLYGKPGLMIASRSADERIQAIRLRSDDPRAKKRYSNLSSTWPGGPDGPSPGSPIHVSYAAGDAPGRTGHSRLGEGELKAYYSAWVDGVSMIALPGVGAQAELPRILRAVNPQCVDVAFDADAETNKAVKTFRDNAARTSAAQGRSVYLVFWSTTPGPDGKPTPNGIDDAGRAGVPRAVVLYPFPAHPGRIETIPAAAMPPRPPKPIRHLNEARAELRWELEGVLADVGPQFAQVCAGTGIGKTTISADLLRGWHEDGWPTKPAHGLGGVPMADETRVLILAVTTEACEEIEHQLPPGLAMRQEGRNDEATHPWGCQEPERIRAAGDGRQNTRKTVCVDCIKLNDWPKSRPGCNYLRSKAGIECARVVIAPATSYFNGSEELEKFDLIIFDEGIFPFLVEDILVNAERVAQWRTRMNQIDSAPDSFALRYPMGSPIRQFVETLDMVQERRPKACPQSWVPAMPALHEACPDLGAIVRQVRATKMVKGSDCFSCESPDLWQDREHMIAPLRALRDLADAVHDEMARDAQADTRLWLTPDGLLLIRPRTHILDILRQRKVINLDATPHDALSFFFPDAKTISIDAPAHQHVTQITDLLGTAKELTGVGKNNLTRLQAAANAICADEPAPVIFSRKLVAPGGAEEFAPTIAVDNPRAQYGWFDNHTRALNRFQEASVVLTVGRYSRPIERIRAEVMAARFSPEPSPRGAHLEPLYYEWRDAEGNGMARYTTSDNDSDVNRAIRQEERAGILQAIGRGRGVNRSPDEPLQVYILSNLPIRGLAVDELTTLEGLGGGSSQRGTNRAFQQQSDLVAAQSAHANAETRARVASAISAMKAEGATITAQAVADRAAVHRVTLYQDVACRAMLDRARGKERITKSVGAGWDNDISLSVPAPTLLVIHANPYEYVTPATHPGAKSRTFRRHPALDGLQTTTKAIATTPVPSSRFVGSVRR